MKRVLLLPILLFLAGCNITVLDAKSDTGNEQAFLIMFSFGLMMIVLITVFILFVRFVIKYRYTEDKMGYLPKDIKGNKKLELTWIILPILLLVVLAIPTIATTYEQSPVSDAEKKDGVHIHVEAERFMWTFTHENGKTVKNALVIPEGETVIFHLKAKDVIHSFWVPALAGKVDVLPGKELVYEIKNPKQGTYAGKCAEYCGTGHGDMLFDTKVISIADYEDYLKK